MALQLKIYSPAKVLFKGEALEIIAPSVNGEVDVLPQHADYLTLLGPGRLAFKGGAESQEYNITGGVLSVSHDEAIVLVDGIVEA